MPKFDASTPRINLKVADTPITSPAPFVAGHALTENEAKFLNRQVATAVANPIPSYLKAELAKADGLRLNSPSELQAFYDLRYEEYELGASNRGSGEGRESTDPVEKFARQIAATRLDALLVSKGKRPADVKKAKVPNADGTPSEMSVYSKLIGQLIEANPDIKAIARAQVDAMNSAAETMNFDLGDLGGGADTSTGSTEPGEVTDADTTAGSDADSVEGTSEG